MKLSKRASGVRATAGPLWSATQRALALLLLCGALPLLAVLWIVVRATSRGPFLYWQLRPGLYGRPFRVCKIRTMTVGADRNRANGLGVTRENPDVTSAGRWLRASKLDELPQLWNVVRGEMDFVGPRPIADSLVELLSREIPGFEARFRAKPGLTSVGQISIVENRVGHEVVDDWRRRHEAELHHLAHRSAAYDLVVIFLTVAYLVRRFCNEFGARLLRRTSEGEGSTGAAFEAVGLQLAIDGRSRDAEQAGGLARGAVADP
jgi:lipopolysaccharide/colanic/teichoic acid biosynthesis glycosyltransferase